MTSASGRSGLVLRGVLAGACAGACVGLADVGRALASRHELVQCADAPRVVGFYAGWFALFGVAAALAARAFSLPQRALHLLVAFGAAFFFLGAWMNVSLLPDYASTLSVTADVALVVVFVLWFRARYRHTAIDGMRLVPWLVAGAVATAVAFAIALLGPSRDDGPAPVAAADPGASRPNVLVYLCDTLRADHLGCYGYGKPSSPEIDAFAQDATLFADCRAPTSWTKPSVASLLTSLYPAVHDCIGQMQVLPPEAESLAEVFRAAGWRTGAFVDNPFVSPEFGFGQGFDDYRYVRPSVVSNGTLLGKVLFMTRVLSLVGKPFGVGEHVERGCGKLHEEFLAQLGDGAGRPWFAYVHAMEPHLPYEPSRDDAEAMGFPAGRAFAPPPPYNGILPFEKAPEPEAGLRDALVAAYDGEIRGLSRQFGALIGELRGRGVLENTIVVFVADHGEEFHEHGGWTHGHSLHRELTQVPFIVRLPDSLGAAAKASRGRKVGGVASLLDVFPTLLDLCSIRYPGGDARRQGESLVAEMTSSAPAASVPERLLYAEVTMGPVGIRSIRAGRWQLLVANRNWEERSELFDDVSDPGHRRDHFGEEMAEARSLRTQLDAAFQTLRKAALSAGERELDAETQERLRALGYVGGKRK